MRTNAHASATFDVSIPRPDSRNRPTLRTDSAAASVTGSLHATMLHHGQMVEQVLADAGQLVHQRDAVRAELVGGTDAGEHQELR